MTVQQLPDDDGVRVLRAEGELDILTAPPILEEAAALVHGARGVVLDLSAVAFCDSSGVRLVDRLSREASRAGSRFRVVAPTGTPSRRVLELVGLAALLADEDLPRALAAVRA
ncbi:MAG: anti-sigma factor antagonist spoIIAA-2 [Frankiales bacterium]|jgi:anti-sigma B factor antagonist|nr:anti-sigma factor antagonist spoIIAA-2 [Frankiales bacterium]